MKRITLLAAVLLLLLSACAPNEPVKTEFVVTDRNNKSLSVPDTLNRIICMSTASTDILVDLGLGDKLVAVDSYSMGKPGVSETLPTFDLMAPDAEQLIALSPDIVVASTMSAAGGESPFKLLTDVGICVVEMPIAETLADISLDIRFLGEVTKKTVEAESLVTAMEQEINDIRMEAVLSSFVPSVYVEVTGYGPYSCGRNTFINELIEVVCGNNIFNGQESWLKVSEEAVLEANPDVILTCANDGVDPVEAITTRNGWDVLTAVKEGKVYAIDPNATSQPNHKVVIALRQIASALQPYRFPAVQ